ncbi:hypothetical protein Cri9333_4751 (plasmid) [Crinalium epipsammum PCC 9333]|uniref:Uncharacterized protein n=1 Tax=Crinalium epipsammum PCC 9333 TaxID=1173022 RepID=K9W700_9CYAN|nr:hypothetical protein [Crinalium epipsammum]AFZ15527.1 hypothetical protein Cri9333_4751 [Crinalium epipsammum PCC 9333]
MPRRKRVRKSLSLRLQPYEGTPLAVVVDYLNSLSKEEANNKVGELLVMTLLPYALFDEGKLPRERLRSTFLASRDLMEKHLGIMALTLEIEESLFVPVANQTFSPNNGDKLDKLPATSESTSESVEEPIHTSLIPGKVTAGEIGNIF